MPALRVTGTELTGSRKPVELLRRKQTIRVASQGNEPGGGCRVDWAKSCGFNSVILEKGDVLWRKERDGSERPSRHGTVFSKCRQNGMLEVKIMSKPEKSYPPGGGGTGGY